MRNLTLAVLLAVMFGVIGTLWIQSQESWLPAVFEAAVLIIAAVWALRMSFGSTTVRLSPVLVPIAAPAVAGAVQLATNTTVYRWATWTAVLEWGSCFAAAFVALQICSSSATQAQFRRAIVYFGLVVAAVSTVQFFTSDGKVYWIFEQLYTEPVLGPFLSPDRYAAFIELLLPVALYEAFAARRVTMSFMTIAAVMLASVIAGASRAGSILVLAEVVVMLVLIWRMGMFRSRGAGRVAVSFVLLGVACTAIVGWTHLLDRFRDPDPFRYRREMLQSSIALVRERPWTGFGLGTFETVYPAQALFDAGAVVDHAHNDWAEWAAEGGIPLAGVLLLLPLLVIRRALWAPWVAGLFFILVHSVVDFPLQDPALVLWACVIAGAGFAGTRNADGSLYREILLTEERTVIRV